MGISLSTLQLMFRFLLSLQGEQFNMKLDKGPRGFGFSLVAAPTFSSDVSDYTELLSVIPIITSCFNSISTKLSTDILRVSYLDLKMFGSVVGTRNFYKDNKPW